MVRSHTHTYTIQQCTSRCSGCRGWFTRVYRERDEQVERVKRVANSKGVGHFVCVSMVGLWEEKGCSVVVPLVRVFVGASGQPVGLPPEGEEWVAAQIKSGEIARSWGELSGKRERERKGSGIQCHSTKNVARERPPLENLHASREGYVEWQGLKEHC